MRNLEKEARKELGREDGDDWWNELKSQFLCPFVA